MKLFVVGSVNMDLVVKAPFVPEKGMTIEGSGFMTNPGGKGANQAVACAKLGGETYMVGCVGEAFGEELLEALRGYGVHTDFVRREKGVSSGIAVITVVDGDNRIIIDRGANGRVSEELIDAALSRAERGDYLILQLEIELPLVKYALEKGKEKGMTTVLNPAPARELPPEIFPLCDWFVPNQTEARFYTGIYPEDGAGVRACAEKLAEKGVKRTLVTLGKEGSAYVCGKALVTAQAYPVEATDTTAAGDTFVGALTVRLSEGAPISEAMKFASKASSIAVTRAGAQQSVPTREEVKI